MAQTFHDILDLPSGCRLDKRLTKAFFLKHFTLSAAEKKVLNENIAQMTWMASLKTSTSNIPVYVDDEQSYEEIQFFSVRLKDVRVEEKGEACAALFQKYLPYAVLLFIHDGDQYMIHAAEKRINQNDQRKRTIFSSISTPPVSTLYVDELTKPFLQGLRFEQLDNHDLRSTYKSYMQAMASYRAALLTGSYAKRSYARSEEDMAHLSEIEGLELEINALGNKVKKEQVLSERVRLNMELQEKRKAIIEIKKKLRTA